MSNVQQGRGRPVAARDEFGNILRDEHGKAIPAYSIQAQSSLPLSAPVQTPAPKIADVTTYSYASVAEFIQAAKGDCVRPQNKAAQIDCLTESNSDWFGMSHNVNAADIERIVQSGWIDGANKMSSLTQSLTLPPAKSARRRRKWADNGDEVEMSRVWAGQLDTAFSRTFREAQRAPGSYRIYIDISRLAEVSGESLFWCGAAGICLADILAQAGHRVEIVALRRCHHTTQTSEKIAARFVVKDFTSPLNIASVAGVSALAGFYRTLGFAWTVAHFKTPCTSCESKTISYKETEFTDDDVNKVFLSGLGVDTRHDAINWLKNAMAHFE